MDSDAAEPVCEVHAKGAVRCRDREAAVAVGDLLGEFVGGVLAGGAVDADAFAAAGGGQYVTGGFSAAVLALVDGAFAFARVFLRGAVIRLPLPGGAGCSSEPFPGLRPRPRPSLRGAGGRVRVRLRRGERSRVAGGVPRRPVTEGVAGTPRAAKAKRTRHGVSLGGTRGTLVRRSCPTDEGPPRAQARSCRSPALDVVGHPCGWVSAGSPPVDAPTGRTVEWEVVS